jgi:uncharacterized protein YjiS (DUF1127 family)
MMTQPIHALTKRSFTSEDVRLFEHRARYLRAAMLACVLTDAVQWVRRQVRRFTAVVKAHSKLRAAEAQLHRMSDRELADFGLCRANIFFAVREAVGETPQFDVATGPAIAANQNLRRAA